MFLLVNVTYVTLYTKLHLMTLLIAILEQYMFSNLKINNIDIYSNGKFPFLHI